MNTTHEERRDGRRQTDAAASVQPRAVAAPAPTQPARVPGAGAPARAATGAVPAMGTLRNRASASDGMPATGDTPAANDPAARDASAARGPRRDWIVDALEERGLAYADLRDTGAGNLWVIGGGELDGAMDELAKRGARFEFTFRGSQATRGRAGWWLAGYPEEHKLDWHEPLAVTDAKLAALEPGDTVFHKAFGYGKVIGIDREGGFIEVVLGTDRHGRPKRRTFLFPNAFEQGLLTL